jgi:hypothetical protein
MGGGHARLVRASTPGLTWNEAAVAEPALAAGSGAIVTQWEATRSDATDTTLLLGCIATPIPGWVEDMRATVDARTVALMHVTAERMTHEPLEVLGERPDFQLRRAGAGDGPADLLAGSARTFVGWDDGGVVTCFAVCVRAHRPQGDQSCDTHVRGATLQGSHAPPPPGLVLGTVTWGVHHPSTAVAWGGALTLAFAALAVVSRRKPRSRI